MADPFGPLTSQPSLETILQRRAAKPDASADDRVRWGWYLLLRGHDLREAQVQFENAWQAGERGVATAFGLAESRYQATRYRECVAPWMALLAESVEPFDRLAAHRLSELAEVLPRREGPDPAALQQASRLLAARDPFLRADLLHAWQRLAGRPEGTVDHWRIAPPLSALPNLGWQAHYPFEDQKTALSGHEVRVDEDGWLVFSDSNERGTFAAMAAWTSHQTQQLAVRVECPMPMRLQIDGKPLLIRNTLREILPPSSQAIVQVTPGEHHLLVVAAVEAPQQGLRVRILPVDQDIVAHSTATAPKPVPPTLRELAALLAALAAGDRGAAEPLLRTLQATFPKSALLMLARAQALMAEPGHEEASIREQLRDIWRHALQNDPTLGRARLALAQQLLEDGQNEEALTLIQTGQTLYPGSAVWPAAAFLAYQDRGWRREAAESLDRALALNPDSCALLRRQKEFRWDAWRLRPWSQRSPEMLRCPDLHGLHAQYWKERGRLVRAAESLVKEANTTAGKGGSGAVAAALTAAQWLLAAGKAAQAVEQLVSIVNANPTHGEARMLLAEALTAAGRPDEARAQRQAVRDGPAGSFEFRRRLALLGEDRFWEPFVNDIHPLLATARKHPLAEKRDMVLVLDQRVSRYFEDGSSWHYSHMVSWLRTRAAVEEFGEVEMPEGAEVLSVATLKADGSRLEPEFRGDADAWSLPGLEPGDVIEYSYLVPQTAHPRLAPDFIAFPFFLANLQAPVLRSDYVVLVDRGRPLRIAMQGEVTAPSRLDLGRVEGYRWIRNDAEQILFEPLALRLDHFVPGVRVASLGWPEMLAHLADDLQIQLRPGPQLLSLAQQLRGQQLATPDLIRAGFRAVLKQVAEQTDDFLVTTAAGAMEQGRGERAIVLKSLFDILDIPNDLVLVQTADRDGPLSDVPDLIDLGYPVLRLRPPDGPEIWLDPLFDKAPLGYLPPIAQGRPAVVLQARQEPQWLTTPKARPESEQHDVRLVLSLAPDGLSAEGQGHEIRRGIHAVTYRELLSGKEPSAPANLIRASLASSFPALQVTQVKVAGLSDPEVPLELDFHFHLPLRAAADGPVEHLFVGLLPEELSQAYVPLFARQTPFLLNVQIRLRLEMQIELPPGVRLASLPRSSEQQTKIGRHALVVVNDRNASGATWVVFRKALDIPLRVVRPEEYQAVARACRTIDQADRVQLDLLWPNATAPPRP